MDEYLQRRRSLAADRDKLLQDIEAIKQNVAMFDIELVELDRAARTFGLPVAGFNEEHEKTGEMFAEFDGARSGFRDFALNLLKANSPHPLRANKLRLEAERQLGKRFHEKTAGMTLYRLSRTGAVRRDGWDWYYVTPSARENSSSISEVPMADE